MGGQLFSAQLNICGAQTVTCRILSANLVVVAEWSVDASGAAGTQWLNVPVPGLSLPNGTYYAEVQAFKNGLASSKIRRSFLILL